MKNKKQHFKLVLLWALLFSLSNCGTPLFKKHKKEPQNPPTTTDDGKAPPSGTTVTTPSDSPPTQLSLEPNIDSMQNNLIQNNCISCHKHPSERNRFVDLHDLSKIITTQNPIVQPGEARKIIRAGCPDISIFYLAIKNNQMPPAGNSRIDDSDKLVISQWIESLLPVDERNCNDEPIDND